MKCFNHTEIDAVGVCKACNKGLCKECAVDTGNGIACHGQCEEEVMMLNRLIDRNKAIYKRSSTSYRITVLIYMAFAVVFLTTGIFLGESRILTIPMGIVFLLLAIYQTLNARKIIAKK